MTILYSVADHHLLLQAKQLGSASKPAKASRHNRKRGEVGPFAKLDILELKRPIAGKLPAQLAAAQLFLGPLAADSFNTFVTAASAHAAFPRYRRTCRDCDGGVGVK